jgi:hypothetical protein
MSFKDYSTTPADNTELGDGTYIGPDMLRNKVRPALQQIAADGKELSNHVEDLLDLAQGEPGGDGSLLPKFTLISTGVDIPSDIELVQTVGYDATDVGSAVYVYDAAVDSTYVTAHPYSSFLANDGRGFRLSLEQDLSLLAFGVKADGITDDTVGFQAAVNIAQASGSVLRLPNGKIRLTAPIVISKGLSIIGMPPRVNNNGTLTYAGSWLYFDHTGKGLSFNTSGIYCTDFDLLDFGTVRNQPAPAGGWAPNAHDFDIDIFATQDVRVDGLMLLNPTKGINMNGGGRLNIEYLRGQPFQVGIKIDNALDVCRIHGVHFWPFWYDDANLHSYTQQNLDAIYSLRNDNPQLSNIFAIYARSGLRIGQSGSGGTRRVHLVNADFDAMKDGIWIDNTVTTGTTLQIENFSHLAANSSLGGAGIRVEGSNCIIDVGNFHTGSCRAEAVKITGTGNLVTIARTIVEGYDLGGTNAAAISVGTGNSLYLLDSPQIAGGIGTGTGGLFGGSGVISVNEWRAFTPVVTPQSGSITTYTATGRYKRFGDTVSLKATIIVTTNGTGAGSLQFTLPITPQAADVGFGRNVTSGAQLQVDAAVSGVVKILTSANAYPATSGDTLIIDLEYQP